MIQRRYDNVSLYGYYASPCSEEFVPANDQVRLTDQGRTVYGGGGVTPDVRLADKKFNDFQIKLRRGATFATFAQVYTLAHPDLAPGWEPTDEIISEFRQFLTEEDVEFTEPDIIENLDFIKRFLKREVYISAYDLDEGERVYYELDPEVQKGLELIPKAEELLKSGKSLIAQR